MRIENLRAINNFIASAKPGRVVSFSGGFYVIKEEDIQRAISTAMKQRVPWTKEEVEILKQEKGLTDGKDIYHGLRRSRRIDISEIPRL